MPSTRNSEAKKELLRREVRSLAYHHCHTEIKKGLYVSEDKLAKQDAASL